MDSYLYALDALTGALHWKFRTSAAIYSSPAASVRDGTGRGYVFVGSTDWKLYAVRANDGLLAWNQTLRDYEAPWNSPPPGAPPPPRPRAAVRTTTRAAAATAAARSRRGTEDALRLGGGGGDGGGGVHLGGGRVCPPNLEQGTSEEAARRFGWNAALACGKKGSSAVGVVSSPVIGPDGVVYVGSSDDTFMRSTT